MSSMTTTEISPETRAAASDLLGFYNLGGTAPDGFHAMLFELWTKADQLNRARLAVAFPEAARAVDTMNEGGPEALKKLAAVT